MDDRTKTKDELIRELRALRAEVAALKQNTSAGDSPINFPLLHSVIDNYSSILATRTQLLTVKKKKIENDTWQQDLKKRQQLEQEVIQREQLFTGFFNAATQSNVGLFILDTNLRFLHINQTLAEINGYSIEFHLGKFLPDLLPELGPTLTLLLQNLIETGQPISNFEVSGYLPSQPGVLRHWLDSFFPIFSPAGEIIALGGMVLEISHYKQAIEALRQSEFNLRTAQRIASVGSWHWDCATNSVSWSEEMYQIHGCDPNQPPPQGKELEPYIHPDDFAHYQQLTDRALAGYSFEVDLRIVRPDGEIRYIEARGEPGVFNDKGELLHLSGTVLDVTARKRVELALRQSEFALREAQRIASVGSWQWQQEEEKISWSEEIYRIHGLDPNSPVPDMEKMNKYIHPDDLEIHQAMRDASIKGEAYEYDLRIIRPDGEVRYVEARAKPGTFNERGELIGLFGTLLDVTERKRVEAQLRQSEANLARAQKIAHIGSWEYDIASQTCTWSEELYRIHQLDPSLPAPVGEEMDRLIHPDDLWINQQLKEASFLGRPSCVDMRIVRQDGEVRHIEVRGEPVFNPQGQITSWVGTVMDITEQHKLERLKSEFVSVVSHELRTPLTSMQVALSLLDQQLVDPTSEDGQGMIHVAAEGVDRLVRLVNDILDLERLNSGKVGIEKQLCYPANLVQSAIDQMKDLANQYNIKFEVSVVPCTIRADPDRLIQVLTNLLSNAIRFSPEHSIIKIHVETFHETSLHDLLPATFIKFMVMDRGRGIPSEQLESIFERFEQVDASDFRKKGGTGLGLAICRSIIQQHGGRIWAESSLGKGSSLYFTLPILEGGRDGKETHPIN
ncbi:PAS domain-containing protein [Phormidium sp. LEGE 05292]|uniref:PAS domain-containing protein n=1 Tax=[Phormidium] sp. LEGE 05292 TaxID=767427 RepID=UPI001881FAE4|nr:PAS domain-containing protein [Phormidium sp. LEGE 05292]MBE9224852.1 PAS domain-containing protein [Phormidium sp. LEGE 05292]